MLGIFKGINDPYSQVASIPNHGEIVKLIPSGKKGSDLLTWEGVITKKTVRCFPEGCRGSIVEIIGIKPRTCKEYGAIQGGRYISLEGQG